MENDMATPAETYPSMCCTIKQEQITHLKEDLQSSSEQQRWPQSLKHVTSENIANVHHNEIKSFGCKFCNNYDATFDSNNDLVQHLEIIHNSQIKCLKCQKQLNPLTEECKTSSCGCKYICKNCSLENCPEIFVNGVSDTKSMILHRKIQPPQCVCNICNNMYPREEIKSHLLKFHWNKKQIMCNKCLKVLSLQTSLLRHMLLLHTGYRKVMCLDCSMYFRNSWSFQNHCLTHEIKQPYVCIVCEYGFISEFSLKHHIKVKHQLASVKKLECRLCKKVWPSYDELVNHVVKIHGSAVKCMACGNDSQLVVKSDPERTSNSFPHQSLYKKITLEQYTCSICKNTFPETQLVSHLINMHTNKKCKKCLKCNIVFSSISNHMKSKHSNASQYECLRCGKMFCSTGNIKRHVSTCYDKSPHKLNSKFTMDPKSLNSSYKHVTLADYTCYICKNIFTETKLLVKHLVNTHLDKTSKKCLGCPFGYKYSSEITRHMLSKHSDGDKTECLICGKIFIHKNRARRHVLDCHYIINESIMEVDDQPFQCTNCPARYFKSKKSLTKHIYNTHSEKKYICNVCNASFLIKEYLKTHLSGHGNPVECQKCGRKYKTEVICKLHSKNCGTGKMHVCKICGKNFKDINYMKRHMDNHSGDNLYKCDICQKQCVTQSSLECHMSLHSDEKPHKCLECGKSYTAPGSLARHMLNHSGDRPHKCTICDASFAQAVILINHMRIHNDERNHQCNTCGQRFRTRYVLTMHMKRHKQ